MNTNLLVPYATAAPPAASGVSSLPPKPGGTMSQFIGLPPVTGDEAARLKWLEDARRWLLATEHIDEEDINNWIPQPIAATMLNMTVRNLLRKIAEGFIEKKARPWPGSGKKPIPVLNPCDVKRLMLMRHVVKQPAIPDTPAEAMMRALPEVMAGLVELTKQQLSPTVQPMVFDLDAAGEMAGVRVELRPMFRRLLQAAIKRGQLPAHKAGRGIYFLHHDALQSFLATPPPKPEE